MILAGDSVAQSIKAAGARLKHIHISAPQLGQVDERADIYYREGATALTKIGYQGFVSIEMRPAATGLNGDRVKKAVEYSRSAFDVN